MSKETAELLEAFEALPEGEKQVFAVEVLRRAVMPHTAVLGKLDGPIRAYRDVQTYEDAETSPGLVVYRFDAPLFFANARK